jgi:hypothetical protein
VRQDVKFGSLGVCSSLGVYSRMPAFAAIGGEQGGLVGGEDGGLVGGKQGGLGRW